MQCPARMLCGQVLPTTAVAVWQQGLLSTWRSPSSVVHQFKEASNWQQSSTVQSRFSSTASTTTSSSTGDSSTSSSSSSPSSSHHPPSTSQPPSATLGVWGDEQVATSSLVLQLQQQQGYQERLRVPLRPSPTHSPGEAADASAVAVEAELTDDDRAMLAKFIGVLTKEGKRSRARRMLLEAMHIIKKELRQSAQAAGSKAK